MHAPQYRLYCRVMRTLALCGHTPLRHADSPASFRSADTLAPCGHKTLQNPLETAPPAARDCARQPHQVPASNSTAIAMHARNAYITARPHLPIPSIAWQPNPCLVQPRMTHCKTLGSVTSMPAGAGSWILLKLPEGKDVSNQRHAPPNGL